MRETSWSHKNKEWQITLDLARECGYPPPQVLSDHGGLKINCPVGDARHSIRVYSTGDGTENVARNFRARIRNCTHRNLTRPLDRVHAALRGAERLIGGAENLVLIARAEERMQDLLESMDLAEESLEQVNLEFDAVAIEAEEASASLEVELRDRDPADLSVEAASGLRTAHLTLRDDLPKGLDEAKVLRERHGELRVRLANVKQAITESGTRLPRQ